MDERGLCSALHLLSHGGFHLIAYRQDEKIYLSYSYKPCVRPEMTGRFSGNDRWHQAFQLRVWSGRERCEEEIREAVMPRIS